MKYLKQPRAQRALLLFLGSSGLFAWFPDLDLRVSSSFYRDGSFPLADSGWVSLLHESVGYFIFVALAAALGLYAFNRVRKRNVCGVDARVVIYLLSVLILGAGLTVSVLKHGFDRARPRNIQEFGGPQKFTPAFVVGDECAGNCSFPSGDGAGAFFTLALAFALGRRRTMFAVAAVFGGLVSFSRIASGAHFLSDSVVSFFVMWIAADALYYYMFLSRQEGRADGGPGRAEPKGLPAREGRGAGAASSHAGASVWENARGAR